MSARQRVALVGLGMALTPHLASLRDLRDRVEIAAAWSPGETRRRAVAARESLPIAPSLEAILEDRTIGAVLVLTPPMTHAEIVGQCATAGKHVLLEKPLDVTLARARQSVERMERAGLCLGVVLQHRFRPASLLLRRMLDANELGELVSSSASIRWWRPPSYFAEPGRGMKARDGGGVLLTQAIHTLDLFLSLTGQPERVTGFVGNSGQRAIDTEDVVAAAICFRGGAMGAIDATTVAYPGFAERLELAGSQGTAVLTAETLDVFHRDGRTERLDGGPSASGGADPMAFSHEAHRALIEDFLDAVRDGRPPAVSGRSALPVHALIEALLKSGETGQPQLIDDGR